MPLVISRSTFNFLAELNINNNRDWFGKNRLLYEKAKKEFEDFIQAFINEMCAVEPFFKGLEASSCIFRINRDIRFSADKSPYKTNFGALVMRGGRKNIHRFAGYYIHIEPCKSMIAGGAYIPPAGWLSAIRERIADEPEKFISITGNRKFKNYFGEIENDKLKSAPRGFDPNHPYIELLKYKSYMVVNYVSDNKVLMPDFFDYVVDVAKTMKPLNDFLNECAE